MAKRTCFFLLLQIIIYSFSYAQIETNVNDTIIEEIIYEYDTIYMAPDTIWIIDTVYMPIEKADLKKARKKVFKKTLHNLTPYSIGFETTFLLAGNFTNRKFNDSINVDYLLNQSYSVHIDYLFGEFLVSAGVGYLPFREKHHFSSSSYLSNEELSPSGNYDSIQITQNYNAEYYYDFINAFLLIGKQWNINKKFSFALQAGLSVDILRTFKQGQLDIGNYKPPELNYSAQINTTICYKVNKNFEIFISPQYQRALNNRKEIPITLSQKTGIGVGIKINL